MLLLHVEFLHRGQTSPLNVPLTAHPDHPAPKQAHSVPGGPTKVWRWYLKTLPAYGEYGHAAI
jgi:hypothetical protein